MTAYTDLAEVRDALKAWGEHSTAALIERAMQEMAASVDRLVVLEEILAGLVKTLEDGGLARRMRCSPPE